jgi:hypothetical protein
MSTNIDERPSTSPEYWVYYRGVNNSNYGMSHGKWMLFYPIEELDDRWVDARNHYDANRFGEVCSMKVSTLRPNPRSSDPSKGVIILFTPEMSEQELKLTGRAIMKAMGYKQKMFYKTNEQTRGGTKATGQANNHTYSIEYCPF